MEMPNAKRPKNILEEAFKIINGARKQAYGPVEESFEKIAQCWNAILGNKLKPEETISGVDVALLMIALKTVRHSVGQSRDDLVDICGYAALAEILEKK